MDLVEGTKRDSGVIFHKVGIAETDTDSGFKGWKLRTLSKLNSYLNELNILGSVTKWVKTSFLRRT